MIFQWDGMNTCGRSHFLWRSPLDPDIPRGISCRWCWVTSTHQRPLRLISGRITQQVCWTFCRTERTTSTSQQQQELYKFSTGSHDTDKRLKHSFLVSSLVAYSTYSYFLYLLFFLFIPPSYRSLMFYSLMTRFCFCSVLPRVAALGWISHYWRSATVAVDSVILK